MSTGGFPSYRRPAWAGPAAGRSLRSYTAATSSLVTTRACELLVDLTAGRPVPYDARDALVLFAVGAWRFGAWRTAVVAGAKGQP